MNTTADQGQRHPLDALFNPRSIAVIGASEKSTWTALMRDCLASYGFGGRVHAVNRNGTPVFSWPGYTSCDAIGEPVDAAFVSVPVEAVAEVIEDLGRAGIRAAVVLSSGYAETGRDGAALQHALVQRAEALGIRLLGPNCLGFANIGAHAAITSVLPRGGLLPDGHVSFVCQSGATAAEVLEFTRLQGVGMNFFAATGNEAQIALADVVDYLVDVPATRVIAVFAEAIRNTARFRAAARRALAAGKPIVILKVGSSELAASVAQAHTGSMVGDDRVFDAACRQLGVIRVTSLEDLVVTAALLAQTGPLPAGGAGVVSISGGACTLVGDQAEVAALELPAFAAETVMRLREVLPGYASTLNPLDVTGAYVRDPSILEHALGAIGADPAIALRLFVMNLPHEEGIKTPTPAMLAAAGRGLRAGNSPGLLVVQTIKPVTEVSRRLMREHGIPGVTGGLDHAVRAAARALWWSRRRLDKADIAPPAKARDGGPVLRPGAGTEREVLAYLAECGAPVMPTVLARSEQEAVDGARNMGCAVVLKIASPDIAHKTEVGGVALDLADENAVRTAWRRIDASVRTAKPAARIDGMLVAPMRRGGIELLVGIARDPDWGRVLALGLGGVWVEVLKDTALRVLPVTHAEVVAMLESLRGVKLLRGYRGARPADFDAIAEAVLRICDAALALPHAAAALEVNPLRVDGAQVEALDALVVWDQEQAAP